MPRKLSPAHIAALQAGRARARAAKKSGKPQAKKAFAKRSAKSRKADVKKTAKIAPSLKAYKAAPNKYDWPGVDTKGSKTTKRKTTTKRKSAAKRKTTARKAAPKKATKTNPVGQVVKTVQKAAASVAPKPLPTPPSRTAKPLPATPPAPKLPPKKPKRAVPVPIRKPTRPVPAAPSRALPPPPRAALPPPPVPAAPTSVSLKPPPPMPAPGFFGAILNTVGRGLESVENTVLATDAMLPLQSGADDPIPDYNAPGESELSVASNFFGGLISGAASSIGGVLSAVYDATDELTEPITPDSEYYAAQEVTSPPNQPPEATPEPARGYFGTAISYLSYGLGGGVPPAN